MNLRIAFLTSEYITEKNYDGGLSNYLYRVTKGLQKRNNGIEVFVISDKNETIEKDGILVHRVIPGAKWHNLLNRFFRNYLSGFRWLLLESFSLNKRFLERHGEKPFDLVQVPNYRASGLFLVLQNKLPLVTRLSSYRKLCNETYKRKRDIDVVLQEWLEQVEIKRSSHVYAPSKFIADILTKELNKKIDVIKPPFFIEIGKYENEIYDKYLKDKQYILFFGTISNLKGVFILKDALKEILKINSVINIVFAGKDTPSYYSGKTCMEKVKEELYEYKDRIFHFNALPHLALYPILMNSKIVVLPSLVDNIPNTCLEAMAHRCVIVASDGASFDELIINGESGFLFKMGDPYSLAEKLLFAWNLPDEERNKISEKAKNAIDKLLPETTLKELEAYYISLIEEWRNKKGHKH